MIVVVISEWAVQFENNTSPAEDFGNANSSMEWGVWISIWNSSMNFADYQTENRKKKPFISEWADQLE